MSVLGIHDQSGGRDEVAVPPTLDVAETDDAITVQRHDSFAAGYFCGDVLVGTLGDSRSSLQGRFVNQITDSRCEMCVRRVGKNDADRIVIHLLFNWGNG